MPNLSSVMRQFHKVNATLEESPIEQRLIAIGGKAWLAGDKNRIYFNNLHELLGLECGFYNTGNVSWARLNGECISNSKANAILNQCRKGKVWFEAGEFRSYGIDRDRAAHIIATLKQRASGGKK